MIREKDRDRISGIQVIVLVSSAIIGAGIMSLPNRIAKDITADGVIVAIISGIGALIITFGIAYLGSRFPQSTVFEYSKSLLGGFLSKIINVILLIYFGLVAASAVRIFANVIKLFLLEKTPIEVIILSLLVVSTYLVQNGINPIARVCEAFFPIVIISISILLFLSLQNFDIKELYSSWQLDITEIISTVPRTMLAYLGFEVLLVLPAFMMKPQKVVKYGIVGTGIATALYVLTVIITIGVFTVDDLRFLLYPTLELAKSISFPGAFAERFDIFYAIFWVLAVFTTIAIYHYLAAFSFTRLLGFKNYRPFCYFLMPIVYFVSLLPQNIYQVQTFSKLTSFFGAFAIICIPAFLLFISMIRKKGVRHSEES